MTEVTDQTFEQEVLKSDVPVLVDFYATWCGPCKVSAPTIEALAEEFEGRIKVVKSNVDEGAKYAMEHGVRGIPAFLLFNNGEVVGTFVGWAESVEHQLREAFAAVLAPK